MEICLTQEELEKISKINQITGLDKRNIIKQALIDYLKDLEILKLETEDLDELSDEALINFEKEYE